jgi:hypothetical protein
VGDGAASVSVREAAIVAEAEDVAPGSVAVTLHTPVLLRPPSDPRHLGLAIEAE